MSAVETLIVYEDLDVTRHTLRNAAGEQIVVHTRPPPILSAATAGAAEKGAVAGIAALSEEDRAKFIDKSTGLEMEQAAEPVSLLEWFAEKHNEYGAALEFVTNSASSRIAAPLTSRRVARGQSVRALVWRRRCDLALQGPSLSLRAG